MKKVLILDDGNKGHLQQSLALLELIRSFRVEANYCFRTEIIPISFRNGWFKGITKFITSTFPSFTFLRSGLLYFCVKEECYEALLASTPDIIISCGAALIGFNIMVKNRTSAANIIIMNPGQFTRDEFDVVIVPWHDIWGSHFKSNVVVINLALNTISLKHVLPPAIQQMEVVDRQPAIALLVGGNTGIFRFTCHMASELARQVMTLCSRLDASLYCTTSRRTPDAVLSILETALTELPCCKLFLNGKQKIGVNHVEDILSRADMILVSGDSISMISEAVASGKPVVVFMPEKVVPVKTKQGRFIHRLEQLQVVRRVNIEKINTLDFTKPTSDSINLAQADITAIHDKCYSLLFPNSTIKY
jgi:mitochondrial fission protein ELM1